MKIRDIIERGLIMPQTIKPLGLIHLPGKGPNNRFDFKNKNNNRANERVKGIEVMKHTARPMGLEKKNGHYGPIDNNKTNEDELDEARGTCWHGYQQKGYKKKGNKMVPNCVKEEAAGVGIITKQNTTADVKPGETTRQANKLHLGLTKKGLPAKSMR